MTLTYVSFQEWEYPEYKECTNPLSKNPFYIPIIQKRRRLVFVTDDLK